MSVNQKNAILLGALGLAFGIVTYSIYKEKKPDDDKGNNLFYFGQ